jgi:hypothetical protein
MQYISQRVGDAAEPLRGTNVSTKWGEYQSLRSPSRHKPGMRLTRGVLACPTPCPQAFVSLIVAVSVWHVWNGNALAIINDGRTDANKFAQVCVFTDQYVSNIQKELKGEAVNPPTATEYINVTILFRALP